MEDENYVRRVRYAFNFWAFAWNAIRLVSVLYALSLVVVLIIEGWLNTFELVRWQEYLLKSLAFLGYEFIVIGVFALGCVVYVRVDRFFSLRSKEWEVRRMHVHAQHDFQSPDVQEG